MTAEGDKSSSQAEFPAQIRRPGQLHILENELKATRAERDNALQLQGQWKEELVQEQRRAAILETNLKYAHEKIEEYKQNIDVLKRNNDLLVQENKDLQGSLHQ